MSKAKEYLIKNKSEWEGIELDSEFIPFLEDMNHKTLEDVKELIHDIETIQSEGTNLWVHKTRLLLKLEKLKL